MCSNFEAPTRRQPTSQASRPEAANGGGAMTLADEIASAQNGAGPLMGAIRKPDAKEALAYVRAHSPGEDDLLEGLSKFTERWLEQVRPGPHPLQLTSVHNHLGNQTTKIGRIHASGRR